MATPLSAPITLPCGLELPNRMVKAAMAENLADNKDHSPDSKFPVLYSQWAEGGWGCVLTGNIQIDNLYLGGPADVAITPSISPETRQAWNAWSKAAQRNGTPAIVQINHPGRQSPVMTGDRGFMAKSLAPSAVPLNIGSGLFAYGARALLFGTPREMAVAEIEKAVQQFAEAAKLAAETGFAGVELHGAHGYLLAQFLSPKSNLRTDAYGGTPAKRAKIVLDAIRAIRKVVPASFAVGLKLNSTDVQESTNMAESLEQFRLIAAEQIDFLEISGGSYEDPRMISGDAPPVNAPVSSRSAVREAFFLTFASALREALPSTILMVTGGFRTRRGMAAALASNACDLVGVGRVAAVLPHWPKDVILNEEVSDEDAAVELATVKPPWLLRMVPLKIVGVGADTMYYGNQIVKMGKGEKPEMAPRL